MTEFVDRLIGDAYDVEMDDRVAVRSIDDVDDAGEEWLHGVTGDDEYAGLDTPRFGGVAEERPHVSGVVDLVDVGDEGDGHVLVIVHLSLLR